MKIGAILKKKKIVKNENKAKVLDVKTKPEKNLMAVAVVPKEYGGYKASPEALLSGVNVADFDNSTTFTQTAAYRSA